MDNVCIVIICIVYLLVNEDFFFSNVRLIVSISNLFPEHLTLCIPLQSVIRQHLSLPLQQIYALATLFKNNNNLHSKFLQLCNIIYHEVRSECTAISHTCPACAKINENRPRSVENLMKTYPTQFTQKIPSFLNIQLRFFFLEYACVFMENLIV